MRFLKKNRGRILVPAEGRNTCYLAFIELSERGEGGKHYTERGINLNPVCVTDTNESMKLSLCPVRAQGRSEGSRRWYVSEITNPLH